MISETDILSIHNNQSLKFDGNAEHYKKFRVDLLQIAVGAWQGEFGLLPVLITDPIEMDKVFGETGDRTLPKEPIPPVQAVDPVTLIASAKQMELFIKQEESYDRKRLEYLKFIQASKSIKNTLYKALPTAVQESLLNDFETGTLHVTPSEMLKRLDKRYGTTTTSDSESKVKELSKHYSAGTDMGDHIALHTRNHRFLESENCLFPELL